MTQKTADSMLRDPRVQCTGCRRALRSHEYDDGPLATFGNAKPGMGHAYVFTSRGRAALCIAPHLGQEG